MKLCKLLFLALYVLLFSGCSSHIGMALKESDKNIFVEDTSIVLLKINIINNYKEYAPEIKAIGISNKNKRYVFDGSEGFYKTISKNGNSYLISLNLKPGNYSKIKIEGIATGFLIMGSFNFLPPYHFSIKDTQVLYLGEINATIIEKTKDDERRAGRITPLLDQSVTGFSGGTFKLTLLDNYESNIVEFRKKYPALMNEKIYKLEPDIFLKK